MFMFYIFFSLVFPFFLFSALSYLGFCSFRVFFFSYYSFLTSFVFTGQNDVWLFHVVCPIPAEPDEHDEHAQHDVTDHDDVNDQYAGVLRHGLWLDPRGEVSGWVCVCVWGGGRGRVRFGDLRLS